MKVRSLGKNQTELAFEDISVLVSYETPVAARVNGQFYRTSRQHSATTTRHINKWLGQWVAGAQVEEKEQAFFDNLLTLNQSKSNQD
jgi:hypothetical protein